MAKQIRIGFDPRGVLLPVATILPLKQLRPSSKSSHKFQQVLSSIREVGVIEPLIVYPQDAKAEMFILLDGHLRLEAVKQLGQTHVRCLIATDDEAHTYNKRVNRIATIQEHVMILGAIKNGVSEDRIARVLSVNVGAIRQRRDLLDGICKEAAEILKNKHLAPKLFGVLKKMKAVRQLEVTELMGAVSNYSVPYAKALLAATRSEMLVDPEKYKPVAGLSPEQVAKMEREMEVLQRDLKMIEDSHGNQVLNLVLARGTSQSCSGTLAWFSISHKTTGTSFASYRKSPTAQIWNLERSGILPTQVSRARIAQLAADVASLAGEGNNAPTEGKRREAGRDRASRKRDWYAVTLDLGLRAYRIIL